MLFSYLSIHIKGISDAGGLQIPVTANIPAGVQLTAADLQQLQQHLQQQAQQAQQQVVSVLEFFFFFNFIASVAYWQMEAYSGGQKFFGHLEFSH